MRSNLRLGAIILCGGKSSRMGRPKHLLPFGDQTVLQRVTNTIHQVINEIVIVAAQDQELPDVSAQAEIVRDEEEYQGPLYGLMIGMRALATQVDAVYLSGCDVPLLNSKVVQLLVNQLGDADIAITDEQGFPHPLAAVYRTSLLETIEKLISEGERRPRALFDLANTKKISSEQLREIDPQLLSLKNMNRPEDYDELLAIVDYHN